MVSAHAREDALDCFSVKDALRLFSDRMSAAVDIGKLFGSETSMSLQSE